MQKLSWALRLKKQSIGFVPTMGALHEGHVSLIKRARKENDILIVSIFVNPIQFGMNEDFKTYPRTFKQDNPICKQNGVDYIFYPDAKQMYPDNFCTHVEVSSLSDLLCGKTRLGHFRGVATVVMKLLNIVIPSRVYFGLKDYQQYKIIKKMVDDLNINVDIIGVPTVREKIGLAMSSRNKYLSPLEKDEATLLSLSLFYAKSLIKSGEKNLRIIKKNIFRILLSGKLIKPKNIEYISIIDPDTLEEVKKIQKSLVIALAVRVGQTRLIDNVII